MRLRLHLELEIDAEEDRMSDWIERLKERKAEERRNEAEREKAQQRKHELIQSMLPEFVARTSERIAKDVLKLRETFPNEGRYDLRFQAQEPGFSVGNSSGLGTFHVGISMDPTQTILRARTVRNDLNSGPQPNTIEIPVELDVKDKLLVTFGGERFYRPEEFAEALVKYVLNAG